MSHLILARSRNDMRQHLKIWRDQGKKIALVPTMGALHNGHIALIELGKQYADHVVTSIFVNPTQFGPNEDLARYPRQEDEDRAKLCTIGCDLLYAPNLEELYPQGFQTRIELGAITQRLEGVFRPHFFSGVATVVAKLLLQVTPDLAIFGEKDWQQVQVVSTMVKDLDLDVTILTAPTVRDPDGLALSSRNAYLNAEERRLAPKLKSALDKIAHQLKTNPAGLDFIVGQAKQDLLAAGFREIDYLEVCHSLTLEPWQLGDPARILVAAWLGQTRLIDNIGTS
ncbi:pantoate--beta-alanine ligase [Candidatus Phycosocius spiralis]|uniref:Pantothenate synthetase n=1 Tax=Candidatus Phycosocius spiralis TaxID=2815099 RepID=A0ABQ4PSD0_9PROT|nr:pantoate--beta-alanine ligase [Candidatus Phycosocius spiralis]GIU65920.1 pantothenate synthetase [Candidatus Phycosocius spiralis]